MMTGMGDLYPCGEPAPVAWCKRCVRLTISETGECGHQVCFVCGRCPPCDGPLGVEE